MVLIVFSWCLVILTIFSCAYLPSVCTLGWNFCSCFCPFSIGIAFLLLSLETILYILDTSPLPDPWFANLSSQSVACLFILLTENFSEKKLFIYKTLVLISLLYFSDFSCHSSSREGRDVISSLLTGRRNPVSPDSLHWCLGRQDLPYCLGGMKVPTSNVAFYDTIPMGERGTSFQSLEDQSLSSPP